MGFGGKLRDDLEVETDPCFDDAWGAGTEKTIVKPGAAAQSMSFPGEGEAGHKDNIRAELCRRLDRFQNSELARAQLLARSHRAKDQIVTIDFRIQNHSSREKSLAPQCLKIGFKSAGCECGNDMYICEIVGDLGANFC